MSKNVGGFSGSRAGAPSQSSLSRPIGFDPGRVEAARDSWSRVLNMDGGRPQEIAAAMWASIYAETLLNALQEVA